jgi:hypothetical protein
MNDLAYKATSLLTIIGSRSLISFPQASPEQTLDRELTAGRRYRGSGRAISLPFIGAWDV